MPGTRVSVRRLWDLHRQALELDVLAGGAVGSLFPGAWRSRFRGRGIEFDEVRPYQWGDDFRILDWKVTARTGEMHTKLFHRCPPWRAKRRRVVPGSREATRDTRRAEGAKGDPKGASERGVQSYGRPVCSRNELAMLWRNAG